MAKFMFLFRGAPPTQSTPEQMQQMMKSWMTWADSLTKKGHYNGAGDPLDQGGKTVRGPKRTVTDAPYAEAKDLVGGYMAITARSIDEAVELARGCPALEGDWSVEVRPVRSLEA